MKRQNLISGLLLLFGTFLVYWPALDAGFIWDDDDYVTNNPTIVEPNGLSRIWFEPTSIPQYYPLVHTSFWLEHSIWEFNPAGYHFTNILFHALSSVLLWRLLKRLGVRCAWLIAAAFAVHPVHVESVAWVTERKNVFACFFYLVSATFYLSWREHPVRRPRYFCAFLAFLCAILSKTVAGSLPAAILLVVFWKDNRIRRADVMPLIPFVLFAMPLGLTTAWIERHHVGASGVDWGFSFAERLLIAGRAVWFYAGKLLCPVDLMFIYPRWQLDTTSTLAWLYPGTAVAFVALLVAMRKRIGFGPLMAVLFFGGTLFPALGFFDTFPMRYSFVADHFQYPASIGLIGLVIAAGNHVMRFSLVRSHAAGVVVSIVLLTVFGWLTWNRCGDYRTIEILWQDTIKKNPGCWMAQANLGDEYCKQGRLNDALQLYPVAWKNLQASGLKNAPEFVRMQNNWGITLASQNRLREAIPHFETASQYGDDALTQANWGNCLEILGQLERAESHYSKAIEIDPQSSIAYGHLGRLKMLQSKPTEGIAHLRKAVELDPNNGEAVELLERVLSSQN